MADVFNMDALLDGTLDDLKDMPEFKPFPAGAHICQLKVVQKKIQDNPAIEIGLKLINTEQLADSNDTPAEAGAETSVAYFMAHKEKPAVAEMGQGQFKLILASAASTFGAKSNRELIQEMNGSTALVVTSVRENKEKTKKYTQIDEIKWA